MLLRAQALEEGVPAPARQLPRLPHLDRVQPVVLQAHAQEDAAGGAPAGEGLDL